MTLWSCLLPIMPTIYVACRLIKRNMEANVFLNNMLEKRDRDLAARLDQFLGQTNAVQNGNMLLLW